MEVFSIIFISDLLLGAVLNTTAGISDRTVLLSEFAILTLVFDNVKYKISFSFGGSAYSCGCCCWD